MGAAGRGGRSRLHSWGHRSCCSHSGRACHTEAPTLLGHTLWDEEGRRASPGVSPLPSLHSVPGSVPQPAPHTRALRHTTEKAAGCCGALGYPS